MSYHTRSRSRKTAIAFVLCAGLIGIATAAPALDNGAVSTGTSNPSSQGALRLNFRDAPLDAVLNYLSETVGLIIVREAPVEGQITVVSYNPLGIDDAIGLLNTALNERGYAAIHEGRRLTIVKRDEAKRRNIPVRVGANPEAIPKTDEMVTQIIPAPHANMAQLLENLQPLLPVYAVATINESSNAIVLTDTQANIRRMVEIVRGLDVALTSGSNVKVYHLKMSKAADITKVVNALFPSTTNGQSAQTTQAQFRPGPPSMPGADGPALASEQDSASSSTVTRVLAVADERSNSVIVSATKGAMSVVDALIEQLDRIAQSGIEARVFTLKFANADETASLINDMFTSTSSSSSSTTDTSRGQLVFGGGPFGPPPMEGGGGDSGAAQTSSTEKTIHAVSDYRTNSVIVTAETGRMNAVEQLVARLDANPARQQKVFIYSVKNATAADLAAIVQGMFSQSSTSTSRSTSQSTSSQSQSSQSTSSSDSGMGGGSQGPMQGGGEGAF
jgi:general secretion pathway protein D